MTEPPHCFSRFRPQTAPHPHRTCGRTLFVGYCSTVVPFFCALHRHSEHISQKKKAGDRNLFYSESGRVTRNSACNLDSSPSSIPAGTRKPGMPISGWAYAGRGGETPAATPAYLHVKNQDADSGFGSTAAGGSAAAGSGFAAAEPASPVATDSPLMPSTTRNPDADTVISSSLRSCSSRL